MGMGNFDETLNTEEQTPEETAGGGVTGAASTTGIKPAVPAPPAKT